MKNGSILSSLLSTSQIYVAIFHHHLYIMCICHNSFDTLEHVLHMIDFWIKASFLKISCFCRGFISRVWSSISQILWSIKRSSLSIQSNIISNAVRHVSRKLLSRFYTFILSTHYSVYRNYTIGLRRVWPINRGCLLRLGIWSHLWYIQGSVFARHSSLGFFVFFYFFFLDYEIYNRLCGVFSKDFSTVLIILV